MFEPAVRRNICRVEVTSPMPIEPPGTADVDSRQGRVSDSCDRAGLSLRCEASDVHPGSAVDISPTLFRPAWFSLRSALALGEIPTGHG
jgi:hypothetical protein